MKLNHQTKYFINGIVLIVMALLTVTVLPPIIKAKTGFIIQNYIYDQIEFFALMAGAIYFLFSPKYYKEQILITLLGMLYYILFVKFN